VELMLIAPSRQGRQQRFKKSLFPPLGLTMVAAATPSDVKISIIDENIEAIDIQKGVDLVGITATTVTANRAYNLADTFRQRGIKVVLGGIHPSFMPIEASQHADAVVIGEAEGIWPQVIQDFKNGKLKSIYQQIKRPSLAGLPIPRRDLLSKKGYIIEQAISTTRGCPYACSFCTVTSYFGHTYRCRPLEEIIKEIETLNSKKFTAFLDDNIVGHTKFAKELFRALIPYKMRWGSQASITVARDDELLKLATDSGCRILLIGFESLSPANLKSVNKGINKVEEYENAIRKIHSYGIAIHGFFIIGFDFDDEDIIKKTIKFARKMRLESAQFDILTPYPGTSLFKYMDDSNRIITKDWSKYGYQLLFKPKSISIEKLQELHKQAWKEFYSLPSIIFRLRIPYPSLIRLWAINLFHCFHWHSKRRI